MQILFTVILSTVLVLGLAGSARAQGAPAPNPATHATISDPEGPPPNPANVPFVLPKDIKWTGDPARQQTAVLYGDQSKEGPYGVLIKWAPGRSPDPIFTIRRAGSTSSQARGGSARATSMTRRRRIHFTPGRSPLTWRTPCTGMVPVPGKGNPRSFCLPAWDQ